MDSLETTNQKSYLMAFNLIRSHAEQDMISKDEAAVLLAGNAIQIVAFMQGEDFTRQMFEAALNDGLQSRKEAQS